MEQISQLYFTIFEGSKEHLISVLRNDKFTFHRWDELESVDISSVVYSPLVWGGMHISVILWKLKGRDAVALFTNASGNLNHLLCHASEYGRVITVRLDSDVRDIEILENREAVRYVRVMKDPRWDFYEEGEPFPFEDTSKYGIKPIRSRLTDEMVLNYCKELGYDIQSEDFYESDEKAISYEFSYWVLKS